MIEQLITSKKNILAIEVIDGFTETDEKLCQKFFQPNIELSAFAFYPMDIKDGKIYQLYDEDDTWALTISDL